ncbi:YbaK/EbsC family protein [Streptomyces poriferorum]|uniref:YbaK/EbsC family protein n=1 Tax=Streptomyces poriferorum TaxID=2798799 RepID=A0ABY9J4U4_9ACTN|nr:MULTISPECIES: YbaK/EbsC family protein [Streptomyces]MBW5252862.1 YbaK/prolyl-tRNA synthetase associated domain-containing protein [Streptomyces poriferorum]MBW5260889.1 YbaK/prolyl-tRNA synthetase associated domain-containing protein [Streptomyces poriferorum]MDP5309439.1 YbaK/EbsC family protein [Streptomyces sp. Alt4]WLQ46021.1 YbaK/EbsC family protein [Streptomyces sp. Alt1]WLQ61364.1 YbaK/EbsC family protein [Streptomyces sp. Alt2]
MSPFEQIIDILDREKARYRIVEHMAEGRSEEVSAVRGTMVSQGAKALVCRVKGIDSPAVLAVLAGDRRADLKKIVAAVEGKKGGFAPSELAEQLTGCAIGAIPPLWLSGDGLPVIADADFLAAHEEIAFNAGRLDRSVVMATEDYVRIVEPAVASIAAE